MNDWDEFVFAATMWAGVVLFAVGGALAGYLVSWVLR